MIKKILSLFFILAGTSLAACGQAHHPNMGENPYQSISGGIFDHVSIENGGLFVHIPILSLPQLGKLQMSFSVTGNGSQYVQAAFCATDGGCEYSYTHYNPCMESNTAIGDDGSANLNLIWDQPHAVCGLHHTMKTFGTYDWENADGVYSAWTDADGNVDQDLLPGLPTNGGQAGDQYQEWNEFRLLDSDGALHIFGYDQSDYARLKANDGSGFVLDMEDSRPTMQDAMRFPGEHYSVIGPDGIRERFTRSSSGPATLMVMSDPSGNTITWDYDGPIRDSVGRKVDYVQPNYGPDAPSGCPAITGQPLADESQTWAVHSAQNAELIRYKLCYAPVSIDTNFYNRGGATTSWCRDFFDSAGDPVSFCYYYEETIGTEEKLQSVILPNGTYWGLSYDQPDSHGIAYGDLIGIRLPTGGSIAYTYGNVPACGTVSDEEELPLGRVVTSRTVIPLVGIAEPTYYDYFQFDNNHPSDGVIERDGDGNEIVHYLRSLDTCHVAETDTKFYEGQAAAGHLVQEIVRSFSFTHSAQHYGFGTSSFGSEVGTTDKILNSETTFQNGITVGQKTYQYDPWFTDVQPLVDVGLSGWNFAFNYSLGPVRPTIVLGRPTIVSNGLTTTVTHRLAASDSSYAAAGLLYIPSTTIVQDQDGYPIHEVDYGYDEVGSPQGTFGNNTSQRALSMDSLAPDSLTSSTFNARGMPLSHTDADLNATNLLYDDIGIFVAEVKRPITNGVQHNSFYGTDPTLGTLLWRSDENASGAQDPLHTSWFTYDGVGRAISATYPDGGSTKVCFSDEALLNCPAAGMPPFSVDISVKTGTGTINDRSTYDGLGRIIGHTHAYGTLLATSTEVTYDNRGRKKTVSNPHTALPNPSTDGISTYIYDSLSRQVALVEQDGSVVRNCFNGVSALAYPTNCPTSSGMSDLSEIDTTDETGNTWRRYSDVFGRLVRVTEPGGLNTTYDYDDTGYLTSVDQQGDGTQPHVQRSFQYDALSRLTKVCNPEALASGRFCDGTHWSTTYNYDNVGNLLSKTDARGVTTSYTYDALNRVLQRSANDGTRTQYYRYDGQGFYFEPLAAPYGTNAIGRLSHTSDATHIASLYAYDAMGRMVLKTDCLQTDCSYADAQSATYDLAGNMTSLTYPDGRSITQTFDGAGRLGKVSSGAVDYFSGGNGANAQYWPSGALQSATLGNGVVESVTLNNRLQPCRGAANSPALPSAASGWNLMDRQSFFNPGVSSPCGSNANNNGNIYAITDNLQVGWSQSFDYDPLNRLRTAARSDGGYNHTYNYDSFGNMVPHDNLASANAVVYAPDTGNHMLRSHAGGINGTWTDLLYDASGNLTQYSDGIMAPTAYSYNATGQMLSINGGNTASYLYDAQDNRVFKQSPSGTTDYVYFNGQPIAEKDQNGFWTDYIYANGQKIARLPGSYKRIHTHGVFTASNNELRWNLPNPVNADGTPYTVRAGDMLCWRQYNGPGSWGGPTAWFSNGVATAWSWTDTSGTIVNQLGVQQQWVQRCADMTVGNSTVGAQVTTLALLTDANTQAGVWDIWYADMSIARADGSVVAIATVNPPAPITCSGCFQGGNWTETPVAYVETEPTTGYPDWAMAKEVHYYLDDHLGTSQMELSSGGWPLWQGQFTPFGQELDTQATAMHYKFTGKERDTESGLDYFGARYYASNMGRYLSPDWAVKQEPVPYAKLGDPQTLNLYSYVQNNPLSRWDDDGHETQTYYGNPSYAAQQANDKHISSTEWKIWGGVALGVGALSGASEIAAGARGLWALGARTATAAYLGMSVLGTQAAQNLMSGRDAVSNSLGAIKDAAASGELNLSAGTASRLGSSLNAISNSFTNSDINGAIKQSITGIEAGGDHVQELQATGNALANLSKSLTGALQNPNLSDQTRGLYTNAVNAIKPVVDQINKLKH